MRRLGYRPGADHDRRDASWSAWRCVVGALVAGRPACAAASPTTWTTTAELRAEDVVARRSRAGPGRGRAARRRRRGVGGPGGRRRRRGGRGEQQRRRSPADRRPRRRRGDDASIDLLLDGEPTTTGWSPSRRLAPAGALTVLVARSLEPVRGGRRTPSPQAWPSASRCSCCSWPATTWVVTGRALRPGRGDPRGGRRRSPTTSSTGGCPSRPGDDEIAPAGPDDERDARPGSRRPGARQQRFVSDAQPRAAQPARDRSATSSSCSVADPDRADVRPLAEGLLAECLRMQGLVDDLLLLARSEELAGRSAREPVDLDDIVLDEARAAARAGRRAGRQRRRVSAGQVRGDAGQLGRMVRQPGRQRRAPRPQRRSASSSPAGDGQVVLVVRDDGPGVPAADRDPRVRAVHPARRGPGPWRRRRRPRAGDRRAGRRGPPRHGRRGRRPRGRRSVHRDASRLSQV